MSRDLDPRKIIVRNRQRKDLGNLTSLENSIKTRGQIHPIVVRTEPDDSIVLMVGGRRLQACINLGIPVKADFWDDLDDTTAKAVELEENIKRSDLSWRDHATAVGELHQLYKDTRPDWTVQKTASEISMAPSQIHLILTVFKNLASPLLNNSQSLDQSYSILQNTAERKTAQIVADIISASKEIFDSASNSQEKNNERDSIGPDGRDDSGVNNVTNGQGLINSEKDDADSHSSNLSRSLSSTSISPKIILNTNFLTWVAKYSGPQFNLIHCDFPYSIQYDSYAKSISSTTEDYDFSGFFDLLDPLVENINKIASYSSHIMFWFSMKFYEQTKQKLESSGLYVHDHPLIWHKTDNAGIIPGRDNAFPRRVYETAFLCSRGRRTLVKSLSNTYGCPTSDKPIHPSQKPEPMLRHFFSMLIDETTDFFDPTCGSGTALRAADAVGARSVLGVEIDPAYAASAESAFQTSWLLRKAIR